MSWSLSIVRSRPPLAPRVHGCNFFSHGTTHKPIDALNADTSPLSAFRAIGKAVSRCASKIPVIESAFWCCGFRGAELLRQTPLQHLQAVLTPEQLALEYVRRCSED